jgi:predicted transcriptional regulator
VFSPHQLHLNLHKRTENLETAISNWLSKRRDQLRIITEILTVAKRGASKTRIMYNANLSFKGVNQYLSFMMKSKLLLKTCEDRTILYCVSEKGLTFLGSYTQLLQLLQ